MKTGLRLLEAASAAEGILDLVEPAVLKARDLSVADAHKVASLAWRLHCHALELERVALGIPAPKRG